MLEMRVLSRSESCHKQMSNHEGGKKSRMIDSLNNRPRRLINKFVKKKKQEQKKT